MQQRRAGGSVHCVVTRHTAQATHGNELKHRSDSNTTLVLPSPTCFVPQYRGFISGSPPHPQPLKAMTHGTRPTCGAWNSPRPQRWPVTGTSGPASLRPMDGLRVWGGHICQERRRGQAEMLRRALWPAGGQWWPWRPELSWPRFQEAWLSFPKETCSVTINSFLLSEPAEQPGSWR